MGAKYVFAADGSQLQGEAKKSTSELRVMQGELKKLEAQSKATYREATLQAKAAGAGTEELRKLQQQHFAEQLAFNNARKQVATDAEAAGRKMVKSEDDIAKAAARATNELQRQRIEVEKLRRAPLPEHLEPSARQKSATLVRGGGLRAAESFAATIPGFAAIADVAFPVVGAAALTAELARGVAKIVELRREAIETGQRLREGFEGINAPIETSVDSLRKQNAELEISIAKLLHKPENGLKLAIAEAALEVDHLADRARSAYGEIAKLLKEQKVGALGALLGQGSTDVVSTAVEGGFRDISERSRDYKEAVRKFGADSEQARNAEKELVQRRVNLRAELESTRGKYSQQQEIVTSSDEYGRPTGTRKVSYEEKYGDQTANKNIIRGALDVLDNQDDEDSERKQNATLDVQRKQLELQNANATKAREAASKAREAAHKAAEEQRKGWEDDLAGLESSGKASASAVHQFWVDRENETVAGTENYRAAERKANETLKVLNVERSKVFDEGLKMREAFGREGLKDALAVITPSIKANGTGIDEAQLAMQRQVEAQQRAKIAVAEAGVQYRLQAGQISKADAAVQMQTLHTIQYEQALRNLQVQMASTKQGSQGDAQRVEIQTKIDDLQAKRAVEVIQDAAAAAGTSWSDALGRANALWVKDSNDSARQVVELYQQALSGVNDSIVHALMGERSNIGSVVKGIGGSLASIGLQKVESTFLGKFGKPDGTRGNPMNVFVVNAADGKGAGSLLPSPATLSSVFGGAKGGDGLLDGIGGIAKDAAMSFLPGGGLFGGFRAFGGGVDEGKGYIVGEKGPEFFSPGKSGFITPNNRLAATGDSSGSAPQVHVDARGAHDPAAVEAAVHRGIAAAAPHIVSASLKASKEQAARRPKGS